jgi:hypothetical protein
MYRPIASIVLLALTLMWNRPGIASDSAPSQADRKQEQKKEPAKGSTASLTGCIDEQEGQYVLLDDQTRGTIASLEADGFETEGFAKHVGHKVTVRGISSSGSARPIFRVRSIETISDTCGAQIEQHY